MTATTQLNQLPLPQEACADPERLVRGGPTLTTIFLVDGGWEDRNSKYHYKQEAGHHRPASETPF